MWEFFVHFTGINQIQVYSKHIRWFQEGSVSSNIRNIQVKKLSLTDWLTVIFTIKLYS